jgi:hypothetical protein
MNITSGIHSTKRNFKPYLVGAVPVVNGTFINPLRGTNGYNGIWDDRYAFTLGMPGWTLTGSSITLGNGVTAFVLNPLPFTQYLVITLDTSTNCTMSQTINISIAGLHTVTFYTVARLAFAYRDTQCSFNGKVVAISTTTDSAWTKTSLVVNIPTVGAYPLVFVFSGGAQRQISITNIEVNRT